METRLKKADSMALKGVAILLMIFHHCYRTNKEFAGYDICFFPFSQSAVLEFGVYTKICVSLFAFVSGYGLMYAYSRLPQKQDGGTVSKWVGSHIVKTLSGYWFIAPFGYLFYGVMNNFNFVKWGDSRFEKLFTIFLDCIGLSGIFNTTSVNGAWWYIGAAVIFVVMVPVFAVLLEKFGVLTCGMLIAFASRIMGTGFLGGSTAYSFLLIMMLGMASCKYDFFEKLHGLSPLKNERAGDLIKFIALLLLVLFGIYSCGRVKVPIFWEFKYAMIPFIVIIFCVEYVFRVKAVKNVLRFLGSHSTNIWLVHTFVRDNLEDVVWSVHYFLLTPLAILGISLIVSICINRLKKVTGYDALIQKIINTMR